MIYPINQMIDSLLETFVDQETGELAEGFTEEAMAEAINKLQLSFEEKIDSLCSAAKAYKAEAADIKDEKMRLAKRQSNDEKAYERTRRFVSYLLNGEKFKNARHTLYYLTTHELVVDSEDDLIQWCKANAPEFLNKPTLRSEDIKRALNNGRDIPFAHIKNNRNVVIR